MDMSNVLVVAGAFIATIIVAEAISKGGDTLADRAKAVDLITANLNLPGFHTLSGWLHYDGFLTGTPIRIPPNVDANTTLVIGSGKGRREFTGIPTFLTNLTAPSLTTILNDVIKNTPVGDTPADRTLVLQWLAGISGVAGMPTLMEWLTKVDWVSGNSVIPKANQPPISLVLRSGKIEKRVDDFPRFLINAKSKDVLDLLDELVYPKDPTLEQRQFTILKVNESLAITGMQTFLTLLEKSGFNMSPQKHLDVSGSVPDAGVTMGTTVYTKAQLVSLLSTATPESIDNFVDNIVQTWDPSLPKRVTALANLKLYMNSTDGRKLYIIGGDQKPIPPTNFPELYQLLKLSGFTSSPRRYTPPPNLPQGEITYKSWGWIDLVPSKWLATAQADDVLNVVELCTPGEISYQKVAFRNTALLTIEPGGTTTVPDPVTFRAMMKWMEENGLYYRPPRFAPNPPQFGPLNAMGISALVGGVRPWQQMTLPAMTNDDTILIEQFLGVTPLNIRQPKGLMIPTLAGGVANENYLPNLIGFVTHAATIQWKDIDFILP